LEETPFGPTYATTLKVLSNRLSLYTGLQAEALVMIEELVELHREILGGREALVAIKKAVELYRRLTQTQPSAFNPGLKTLTNLSFCVPGLGLNEEALSAAKKVFSRYLKGEALDQSRHRSLGGLSDTDSTFSQYRYRFEHAANRYQMGRREEAAESPWHSLANLLKISPQPSTKSIPASDSETRSKAPVFPLEIFEMVSESLFQLVSPKDYDEASIISYKPAWVDVAGFIGASPELHAMGFVRWVRVLTVGSPDDWEKVLTYSHLVL
jgi:hypothetical protein